jgi:hypothetical protein
MGEGAAPAVPAARTIAPAPANASTAERFTLLLSLVVDRPRCARRTDGYHVSAFSDTPSYDRSVPRSGLACIVASAIAAAVCAAAMAASPGKPAGTFNGCPSGLVPPPSTYKPAVRHAASVFLTTTYAKWNEERHWGMRLTGARVGEPFLVRHWLPSGWVRTECGNGVWRRSVGVNVSFPAMEYPNPKGPCNDCAHVTLLLGKTSRGWVTWGNY